MFVYGYVNEFLFFSFYVECGEWVPILIRN